MITIICVEYTTCHNLLFRLLSNCSKKIVLKIAIRCKNQVHSTYSIKLYNDCSKTLHKVCSKICYALETSTDTKIYEYVI